MPQPIRSSMLTWQGTPWRWAAAYTVLSMILGPQASTAWISGCSLRA